MLFYLDELRLVLVPVTRLRLEGSPDVQNVETGHGGWRPTDVTRHLRPLGLGDGPSRKSHGPLSDL